jgi:AcrR family transcriptional regulator
VAESDAVAAKTARGSAAGSAAAGTARERILDAAASVMREKGIAAATTKEIARAAGYSEAMLYKHFEGKSQLFVAVLDERLPSFREPIADDAADVRQGLERIVEALMRFYFASLPIAASILGSPDLLDAQRRLSERQGVGPQVPVRAVSAYLRRQRAAGRLPEAFDVDAVASLLTGAALHSAFLAVFSGRDELPAPDAEAKALVAAVLPRTEA